MVTPLLFNPRAQQHFVCIVKKERQKPKKVCAHLESLVPPSFDDAASIIIISTPKEGFRLHLYSPERDITSINAKIYKEDRTIFFVCVVIHKILASI
jgi:hypothetical protein